jgi:hypothetical protein
MENPILTFELFKEIACSFRGYGTYNYKGTIYHETELREEFEKQINFSRNHGTQKQ